MLFLLFCIEFKLHKNNSTQVNQLKLNNAIRKSQKLLSDENTEQFTCQDLQFNHEWTWRLLSASNSYINCEGSGSNSKVSISGTRMQGVRSEKLDAYPNGIIHVKNADFESTISKIDYCAAMNKIVQLIFFEGTGTHKITSTIFEFCGRSVNNYKPTIGQAGEWWPNDWNPSLIYIKGTSTNTITDSTFDHPETGTINAWEFCPVRCIRTSDKCKLTVTSSHFHNATSFEQGGAFFWLESEVSAEISYCDFRTCNDRSYKKYHAIYSSPSRPVENKILHCTFTDCGSGNGVTICAFKPILTFEDNTIKFNDYTKSCRCIECNYRGQYTFRRNTFVNAQTKDDLYKGTGIHMYNEIDAYMSTSEEIKINDNTFDCIWGDNQGRCLQIIIRSNNVKNDFSSNTIKNCPNGGFCLKILFYTVVQSFKLDSWTFMSNKCTDTHGGGAGIWVQNFAENGDTVFHKLNLNIENCKFMNNWSGSKGGALQVGFNNDANKDKYVVRNQVTIIGCTFQGNQAIDAGGSISIQTFYPLTIENCMFIWNKAPKGGAIYVNSNFDFATAPTRMESATIYDCTFYPNRGNDAHIMYFERSPITHVTLVRCNIDINFDSSYETSKVLIYSEIKELEAISCTFYSGSMQSSKPCNLLFNIINTESLFSLDNCTFNIPNDDANKILDVFVDNTKINNYKFKNFGNQALTINTNYFDFSYNDIIGSNYFMNVKNINYLPTFYGNIFHDFVLTNKDFNFVSYFIYNIDEFVLENNTFSNMRGGSKFGGGIGFVFQKADMAISYLTFKNCKFHNIINFVGSSNGGAICLSDNVMFTDLATSIQSCEFKGNRCQTSKGGSIYINTNYDFTVSDCIFDDSNSQKDGGAIYITSKSVETKNIKINNCIFKNCLGNGYAIAIESGKAEIEKVTVLFDDSDGISNSCGGINLGDTLFQLKDSQFIATESKESITFNQAQNSNEIIYVQNCTFNRCKAENRRCFNIVCRSPIEFKDNTICNMAASGQAGYFCSIETQLSEFIIDNMTFINNECNSLYGGGSGLWIKGPTKIIFQNCKFINNSALEAQSSRPIPIGSTKAYYNGDGGGIQFGYSAFIAKVNMEFLSCLFKSNKAVRHGGAIALQTLGDVLIKGCKFEENIANYKQQQNLNKNVLLFENHFDKKTEGRGGAIYLNPCYTNSEITDEYYMKSVTIEDCKFLSNSAFDGFAIYIEGDDPNSRFSIIRNDFINNFNAETFNENSSVISTEICRKDLPYSYIKQNNNFSNEMSVREIICVDHYGKALLTAQFSKSTAFSESNKFSPSDKFSFTDFFSRSKSFTSSFYFSKSSNFDPSSIFSRSKMFSSSFYFSESYDFSSSKVFSKTGEFSSSFFFSGSKDFSSSYYFSVSDDFSSSIYFTKTDVFSTSFFFSMSDGFTETGDFSPSIKFSKSSLFSETSKFSSSFLFLQASEFTQTSQSKLSESINFSESPEQVESSESPEQVDSSESPEQVESSESPEQVESSESPEQVESSESPEQVDSSESPEQVEPSESPEKVDSSESPEQVESSESPEQVDSSESLEQVESSESFEQFESSDSNDSSETTRTFESSKPIDSEIIESTKQIDSSHKSYQSPDSDSSSAVSSYPVETTETAETKAISIPPVTNDALVRSEEIPKTSNAGVSHAPAYSNANANKSGSKKSMSLIIGIVVGLVALLVIVLLITVFIIKKKRNKKQNTSGMENQSEEVDNEAEQISTASSAAIANPLFNGNMNSNDPFDQEFEEDI